MQSEKLLQYLQQGIDNLIEKGAFEGGQEFRPTQHEALLAYQNFLGDDSLSPAERLKGFFEIPTGVGKTAIFVSIVTAAHKAAETNDDMLKTAIVVPTTQLLGQTLEAFEKFAPSFAEKIGLYGDGKKNLRRPITVMTYDAWYDLAQSGKIGSHNIDILISDEAHRGTSERRIENIKDAFNEQSAQMAFTATAHFDEDKSVQESHEREIFYKSVRDAVLEGELASYIQSQRAVIRAEPTNFMLSDEFEEADTQSKVKYRKRVRQKAWNDFALKTFREGKDERTKDLLSDNQAGFFVEDIAQSDKLEKMLNADEVLQARVSRQGRQGVAVAIHSGLSKAEQKRRFEAYRAGEYLAVIGDEKFKEGFDHPPLKTLFDTMHSSIVDKAQIIGRGARKWWNEAKERSEGLTVIDTAIYIGSNDKEEDELLRAQALRKSVSVKEILEESPILGPGAPQSDLSGDGGRRDGGEDLFHDDPNVEYATDIEHIHEIEAEVSELRREHFIPITDEMRKELNEQVERTGVGSKALLSMFDIHLDFSHGLIDGWRSSRTLTVDKNKWSLVIDTYRMIPDQIRSLEITDDMRKNLNCEVQRTGVGSVRLLQIDGVPEGLTETKVNNWRYGGIVFANLEEWCWVLQTYKSLDSQFRLTEEHRIQLRDHMDRTGVGAKKLVSMPGAPEALQVYMLDNWLNGNMNAPDPDIWRWVINTYETLPVQFKITQAKKKELNNHVERTGVSPYTLVRSVDAVSDIKEHLIRSWRNGNALSADEIIWNRVISAYAELPDKDGAPKIKITDAKRKELLSEFERTAIGSDKILKLGSPPKTLTSQKIKTWRSGRTKTAIVSEWNWVMRTYKSQPDRGKVPHDPEL